MGSTAEADRKRPQLSSLSPTPKKHEFSRDKKLDTAVLQFQNQKLSQKFEAKRVEYIALEDKFFHEEAKQKPYDSTLEVVNNSWQMLVHNLQASSIRLGVSSRVEGASHVLNKKDGVLFLSEDAFLSRFTETGPTESSSSKISRNQIDAVKQTASENIEKISSNLVTAIDDVLHMKDVCVSSFKVFQEEGSCSNKALNELESEVKNLRLSLSDIYLKHKSLSRGLGSQQDSDAKEKAEVKRLRGETDIAVTKLDESNHMLVALKADRDATKEDFFPVLNFGSKHNASDRVRDKQKHLQDLKSTLKELLDQSSSRLLQLKSLHEERIKILEQLSNLQNTLKNVKCISSSQAYILVRDRVKKAKSEVLHCQALFEKLQVEKENLIWRERELVMKKHLLDVSRKISAFSDSRISYLRTEIQKQLNERRRIEIKLEEASREPGRKESIAEFKVLVSSFSEEIGSMQSQLSNYKETALDIHSLRADVQSVSYILDRKEKVCGTLSARSPDQDSQIHKLRSVVQDLKASDKELKLFLDMYRRESTDSSDHIDSRDLEYKAWAHVLCLKASLDERNLELRVKAANEAEAVSQQRLVAAEAEISDIRQTLEASKRDMARHSNVLKSKTEENETYLSEIETIGQAYDDMQTQNQNLLQQVTERDDCNIKLVVEGVRSRHLQDALLMDKNAISREYQQINAVLDFLSVKTSRMEDQLRFSLNQDQRLRAERSHKSSTWENTQRELLNVRSACVQSRESLEESQSAVDGNRLENVELQMESDKGRYERKRKLEELDVRRRKISCLQAQIEGSSALRKLEKEHREYEEILKCSICVDGPKEVVITKCYHLFCNSCMQKVARSRHRKCPICTASFGLNDIKPVYI